ncbi:MAG: ABC-type antimicrobial peptide transport system, ATPase component [Herbinix sp.]|jgi:ABC-type lipoprotein export system ATPase subunit|nr:ABC-type antimicrobial peptide transport system, ATPase component [Herbinix sp.]
MIQCDNLVKIYKTKETEVVALQGLDITIEEKEFMAIIGNSGSGKSTFLNLIGALNMPTAGRLFVDGKDLFQLNKKEMTEYKRKTVGFVWQNNGRNLLPYLTAIQNIELPLMIENSKKSKQTAQSLLELVGMAHKRNSYPLTLSGGEQQRVAIAVALANQPKILLADEPTGAVDVKTSDYIFDIFKEINREFGTTIVVVTHDRGLASKVHRVASIRDGKISSEQLIKNSDVLLSNKVGFLEEMEKEEYSILDRAGRLQIPKELLEKAGISSNRVKVEYEEGHIKIYPTD